MHVFHTAGVPPNRGGIIFAIIGSIRNNRPALVKSVMENITGRDLKENREVVINFFSGGSVWESNPPCHLLGGNTGFEVREGHQNPMHSHALIILDLLTLKQVSA